MVINTLKFRTSLYYYDCRSCTYWAQAQRRPAQESWLLNYQWSLSRGVTANPSFERLPRQPTADDLGGEPGSGA